MPVLPDVASTTVWPGRSLPLCSASSITPSARRLSLTTGVQPMDPRMLSYLRFTFFPIFGRREFQQTPDDRRHRAARFAIAGRESIQ